MLLRLLLVLAGLPFAACVWAQSAPESFDVDDLVCKWIEAEVHRHAVPSLAPRAYSSMDNYDLKYHRLAWYLDPAQHYIQGSVTSYFVPTESEVRTLFMQLSDSLRVDSVLYRGRRLPFVHSSGDWLGLYFPEVLRQGSLDSVTVFYQGAPPDGRRSFEQDEHEGAPIIWTLSQPYGAKDWWPCKQTLDDKIDSVDIYVSVPPGNRAASNGVLVAEQQSGDTLTFHFRHRYPIPAYLIAVGVTNYAVVTHYFARGQDSLPVVNYIYPEDSTDYRWQTARALDYMAIFDTLLGTYPFDREQYGHAQFGWPGGMEHQTMSFMYNFDWSLVGHELAHMWAGDLVTCGSWQDIWLNEGLTTYLTGYTYQYLFEGRFWPIFKAQNLERILRADTGSVYVPAADTLNVSRVFDGRLSYRKGAMVTHMLRWVVGEAAFIDGLRRYFDDPALRFGYATTPAFQEHMEQAGDTSLQAFFDDWIYGEGHPIYTIQAEQVGDSLIVVIGQQSAHPSVDFFEMKVPLGLYFPEGDSLLVSFDHRFDGQRFALYQPRALREVKFDPELWLVAELDTLALTSRTHLPPAPFRLYPQPAQQALWLEWRAMAPLPQEVQLWDPLGRMIYRSSIFPSERKVRLSLLGLPAGFYSLQVKSEAGVWTKRIWKQ